MNVPKPSPGNWRSLCQAAGLDPAEVEMVSVRYRAYRDYMGPRGGGLGLEAWFRFYCIEKESEHPDQAGGGLSGCSAAGEAAPQNVLTNPRAFLEALKAHVNLGTPA